MSKSDGFKLPKTIAGLKIPKALRKSGALDLLVATPETRQLLADTIMAAAKAASDAILAHRPADEAVDQEGDDGEKGGREFLSEPERRRRRPKPASPSVPGDDVDQAALPSAET